MSDRRGEKDSNGRRKKLANLDLQEPEETTQDVEETERALDQDDAFDIEYNRE